MGWEHGVGGQPRARLLEEVTHECLGVGLVGSQPVCIASA